MSKINMRMRVLLTALPIAVIPIIIVAGFSAARLFGRLKEQGNVFHSTILRQVANNIDFIYTQYAMSFVDITNMENFKRIVEKKSFTDLMDERNFLENMGELTGSPAGNSISSAAFSKFKGAFFLVDMSKRSLLRNEDFYKIRFSLSDAKINIPELIKSDLFKSAAGDRASAKLVYGRPPEGVLSAFQAEQMTMFVYPYFRESDVECSVFMIVLENKDFMPDVYRGIESLKFGTLYVIDRFNRIISRNHPSSDDYYIFDREKGRYVLDDDDPYIEEEGMGIADYRLLNTDESILNMPIVSSVLNDVAKYDFDFKQIRTVVSKGVDYLIQSGYSPQSEIKLVYFHPLPQLYRPIYDIIFWIVVISIIVSLVVGIISFYLSNRINTPISKLSLGSVEVSKGNYKFQVNTEGFFGEFIGLGNSFNSMTKTISDYSEHLEDLVKKRTEELNKANLELQEAYEENKRELLMAQRIQSSLIPKVFPESEHIDFSGMYLPMEALGGDLYDVHKISEKKMGIVILDVCGHGVPAALITTMAKISFNANSKKFAHSNEIVAAVNEELCDAIQGSGDYFTAFYCIIDAEKKTIEYTNAAHNDIYILRGNGSLESLVQTGPVVGVVKQVVFEAVSLQLSKGDRVVLYTDGVIEARSEDRSLYDADRFQEVIIQHKDKSPKDFVNFIYNDILSFKNNTPHDDDIAILIADMV